MPSRLPAWPAPPRHIATVILWLTLAIAARAADAPPLHPSLQDTRSKISSAIRQHLAHPATSQLRVAAIPGSGAQTIIMRLDAAPDDAVLAAIAATGARVVRASSRWHEVQVEAAPATAIALALIPEVRLISPAMRPRCRTIGSFIDQADAVIHADQLRTTYATTGSGITVGVISDSINLSPQVGTGTVTGTPPSATLTGTTPQRTGDLPASIALVDPGAAASGNTDEGAAMMEELYHLAPGATYAFATAGIAETDTADNIAALTTAGCRVICDDILFFGEPMFQDGPVAQAIDTFTASGGIFLSAAGNDGDQGILTTYVDVNPALNGPPANPNDPPTGNDFHNWGIGGSTPTFLPLIITPDSGGAPLLTVVLEWNQPYQSNNLGKGSESDYDLYLFSQPKILLNNLLDYSANAQGTPGLPAGDPLEFFQHQFSTRTPVTVYLSIDRYAGAAALFRLVFDVSGGTVSFPSPPSGYPAATIYGHPAAASALAIAAAPYSAPQSVESFSGRGGWGANGLPFYFDKAGNPLAGAPLRRNKPELTAPDGVDSSLVDFTPFYGTSGATPHAAAAVTLLWSIYPKLSPQAVVQLLTSTATDITAFPASLGNDARSGYGLVNALAAAAAEVPDAVTGLSTTPAHTTYQVGTVPIQVTFASAVTVTGIPTLALNTTPPRSAYYVSGSGTSTLAFSYTISAGDTTSGHALDAAATSSLSLAGGTISSTSGNLVTLTLPTGSTSGALAASQAIIDGAGPGLVITPTPAIANHPAFSCSFVFSQAVNGFPASAITVGNGTLSAFSGSGSTYTATITATAPGAVLVSVSAGAVLGAGGYPSFPATASMTYDTTPPTLAISAPATTAANSSFQVAFAFSEAVTGFAQNSVVVTGAQVSAFSGSGASYAMTLVAGDAGSVGVNVAAGAATDLAGNALASSSGASIPVTAASGESSYGSSDGGGGHCGLGGLALTLLAGTLFLLRRAALACR